MVSQCVNNLIVFRRKNKNKVTKGHSAWTVALYCHANNLEEQRIGLQTNEF